MKVMIQNEAKPMGFRRRIAYFLATLVALSFSGLFLMKTLQESQDKASKRLRTMLLPTAKLLQSAKTELDLQIQELGLISAFELKNQDSNSKSLTLNPHQQTLLRLSPSLQALLQLNTSPLFPRSLRRPFQPWSQTVRKYQERLGTFNTFQEAINQLEEIRDQTSVLEKNLDREFSFQLFMLETQNQQYLRYWILLVLASSLLATFFAILFWRWIKPLDVLTRTLRSVKNTTDSPLAPTSFTGAGISAPPREIQELSESVRFHLLNFLDQQRELVKREAKIADSERATSTLLSALFHLTRHNEELLQQVIKSEKLASMSEMGAQLAHEIRNPLNSMSLKLEMLRENLSQEQREIVDRILREVDRLDALTESHLSGTRANLSGEVQELCHLQSIADECIELFSDEIKIQKISVEKHFSKEGLLLRIPRNVIKSALINLLKNAIEAVSERDVRTIKISIEKMQDRWQLQVQDSGPGLPEGIRAGQFKSFVTFKKHGSGLGLATAQKMLEAWGVTLKVFTASPFYATSIGFEGTIYAEKPLPSDQDMRSL